MWNRVRRYYAKQVEEVQADRVLQLYGAFLSIVIPLSYYFWRGTLYRNQHSHLASCWPFWPNCETHPLRVLGELGTQVYWVITIGLALAATTHFVRGRAKPACAYLGLAFLLKGLQETMDYTFMGNYHYMPFILVAAFLLVAGKRALLKCQIVLFYFFAGILKLHPEWLQGAAITERIPWMPEWFFQLSVFYVVILELVLVWGLLSLRRGLVIATLAQLVIFHGLSYYIVGYFYPAVMALLLSLFALELRYRDLQPVIHLPKSALAFLFLFFVAQLAPAIAREDSALFTHWRISSLNMFDAATQCEAGIYIRREGETIEYIPDYRRAYGLRLRCDPILVLAEARSLCQEFSWDPKFITVDAALSARRATDHEMTPVLRETDICGKAGGH